MRPPPLAPVPALPDGIAVPDAAWAQDGVFTRSQARAEGWEDRRQRRMLRVGLWTPLAGPVLRHREVEVGPWQRARAVQLTAGLVTSHHTAGQLWQFAVSAGLHGIGHLERRTRPVRTHRHELRADEVLTVRGLPLTSPIRTLTDLICTLDEQESVSMLTEAFRRGALTAADLHRATVLARGRHGVNRARHLSDTCRREPHSPLEWRFHGVADAVGPGWVFNAEIHDSTGFVGRVDALHEASGTIVELDGRQFHGEDRFQADRTRDQRLTALGYVVVRITWADLERHPLDVVERLRRTIAHRSRRRPSRHANPRGR